MNRFQFPTGGKSSRLLLLPVLSLLFHGSPSPSPADVILSVLADLKSGGAFNFAFVIGTGNFDCGVGVNSEIMSSVTSTCPPCPCPTRCPSPSTCISALSTLFATEDLKDLLWGAGCFASGVIVYKYGQEIPKYITQKLLTTKEFIFRFKSWIIIPQSTTLQAKPELRRNNLVRWLGRKLPASYFPTPRVYVHLNLMDNGAAAVLDWIDQGSNGVPLRELGNLEEFRDGLVFAYEGSGSGSLGGRDTDLETVGTRLTEDVDIDLESNIESGFAEVPSYVGFVPYIAPGGCSTPNSTTIRPTAHHHENLSTIGEVATNAQIQSLQSEISEMKGLLHLMLKLNGNGNNSVSAVITSEPIVAQRACPIGPPPPPPPPPPPMPLLPPTGLVNGINIKLKTKSELAAAIIDDAPLKSSGPPSMSDVLKGLAGVKLKPTPRSPGGTPLKQPKSNSKPKDSDPGALLAAALQKRFATCHSPSPHTTDDEYNSTATGDESSFFNKENNEVFTSLAHPNRSPIFSRVDKDNEDDDDGPLFGQHLLRRRLSNSLLKKKSGGLTSLNTSLRDQN